MKTPHASRSLRRPSRRDFLAGSAAIAAPAILSCQSAAAAGRLPPEFLRVGLVGCGGRGTGAALQALSAENGTVVLTAAGDCFADRVERCLANVRSELGPERADRLRVDPEHVFTGLDSGRKVIESDVDVVLLCSPPYFRPAQLALAVEKGRHVFCEKPMAVDAPGLRSVLASAAVARQKRLSLVAGFCWRYNPRHRELFRRVHAGQIGDVHSFYSTYLGGTLSQKPRQPGWSDAEWQIRNWQHFTWLSGDHVVEQAVHSLDKMAWCFRDAPPLSVSAVGGRQARTGESSGNVWDHFAATFDYANGAKGFHMCRQSDNCAGDNNDWIQGSRGRAEIRNWEPRHEIFGENAWVYAGEERDMYQQEHDELFASIRAGEPIDDGEWMAHSTMLALMLRMSAYSGQTITWEQAMSSQEVLGPKTLELGPLEVAPVAIPGKTPFV